MIYTEFEIDKSKTVCFTGHRPEKLPGCGEENSVITKAIKSMIAKHVIDSMAQGYNCFITGMARGIDLWAGDIVLSEKKRFKDMDIKLIAAIPYRDHGKGLKGYDLWLYGNILNKAHKIIYVSENYHKQCMAQRNQFMVDNSSRLIAAASDMRSGAGQTIRMAQKQGLDIKYVDLAGISLAASGSADEDSEIIMHKYFI